VATLGNKDRAELTWLFLHFSLGIDLCLSYWNAWKWRIHIPTNGAISGFSGVMGHYTELKY